MPDINFLKGFIMLSLAMAELATIFMALPISTEMAKENSDWYMQYAPIILFFCGIIAVVIMFITGVKYIKKCNERVLGRYDNEISGWIRKIKYRREKKKYGYIRSEIGGGNYE